MPLRFDAETARYAHERDGRPEHHRRVQTCTGSEASPRSSCALRLGGPRSRPRSRPSRHPRRTPRRPDPTAVTSTTPGADPRRPRPPTRPAPRTSAARPPPGPTVPLVTVEKTSDRPEDRLAPGHLAGPGPRRRHRRGQGQRPRRRAARHARQPRRRADERLLDRAQRPVGRRHRPRPRSRARGRPRPGRASRSPSSTPASTRATRTSGARCCNGQVIPHRRERHRRAEPEGRHLRARHARRRDHRGTGEQRHRRRRRRTRRQDPAGQGHERRSSAAATARTSRTASSGLPTTAPR